MMKFLFLAILFILLTPISAQVIRGTITDSKNEVIPFAKVKIQNSSYGTVANANGYYILEVKKGIFVLEYSASGYTTQTQDVIIDQTYTNKDIKLVEQVLDLNEVTVNTDSKKDKGKEIMKKAIDKRKSYAEKLSEYTCNTFCYTSLEKNKIDSLVKDSIIGKEKLNMIEWEAITSYKSPSRYKNEFIAYKDFTDNFVPTGGTAEVSFELGDERTMAQQGSLNNDPYIIISGIEEAHFSLLDNTIEQPKLIQNPLISPLAYNAFIYYSFYFEKTFLDSTGTFVNEILVKPRFDYEALFEGSIFIRENTWELVSYDLAINKKALLFLNDLRIIADYKNQNDTIFPTRKEFIYDIKEGKQTTFGLIKVSHSNYSFKVDDSKKRFWLESSVFTDDAFDKDTSYWNKKRPYTLKDFETKFIHEQDSIINYHESDEYKRKQDSIRNQFRWVDLFFSGIGHSNSFKKQEFRFSPLVEQIIPFGVGGYRHRLSVYYKKEFENGKIITLTPDIDYGFLNKDIKGSFDGSIMYNPMNFSKLGFAIGDVYDFVTNNVNIQGTFAPANRVRNQKFDVYFSRELINGLYLKSSLIYSDRQNIKDISFPEWMDVFGVFQQPQDFDRYKILMTTFDFEYHFRQKYIIRKKRKIVLGSPWPTLFLQYRKAIPTVFNAEADFDFFEVKIHDELDFNSFGVSEVKAVAGGFMQKKDLRLIEHKFFRPSDIGFFSNPINTLQLLDTALNTNNSYFQLNFIHHFNGFFLNKIWGINKLKLEETIGGGFLGIPDANFAQFELYVGLERKIRIRKTLFKVGFYACSQNNTFDKASIQYKFGINFFDNFSNKWQY